MGQLVFQANSGGQTNLVGQNTAFTFNLNIPLANGTLVSTGDTGTVTNTMLAGSITNAKLVNSSVTIGSTSVALGATSTTLAGLTSVAATTIGAASGSALSLQSNGTTNATLDSSGNLGLGVTPSAWGSGWKGIDVGSGAGVSSTSNTIYLSGNAYNNGTNWKYINSASSGMYYISGNTHAWFNAASGTAGNAISFTQAMTLNNSGNLGIGSTSPYNPGGSAQISTEIAGTTYGTLYTSSGSRAVIGFFSAENSDSTVKVGSSTNNPLLFSTNSTERARIDSSGNLLVGTTSAGTYFGIRVEGIVAAVGYQSRSGISGSFGGNRFNMYWTGSATQLWVDNTNLGTITVVSDYRLKQNVKTQELSALDRVVKLRPVTYEFQDYGNVFKADGVSREGFIAHELQEVIPSAVEGEKDAEDQIQSLRLDALCSVLTKAIQELKAEFDAYKASHP